MDPLTLITSALVGGASQGLKDTSTQAVKDAYNGVKERIRRHFLGRQEAEMAMVQYETKPEVWEPVLRDQLAQVGADQDQELLGAAQHLMALLDPPGSAADKYKVQFTGSVQGVVIGDHPHVTQTFGPGGLQR